MADPGAHKMKCPQCEQPAVTLQPPNGRSHYRRAECGDCGYKFKLVPSAPDEEDCRRDRSPARERSRSPERERATPQCPEIDVVLQYNGAQVPRRPHDEGQTPTNVAACRPKGLRGAMPRRVAVDDGKSMHLLQEFMRNFVASVPGLRLWLRILFFGGESLTRRYRVWRWWSSTTSRARYFKRLWMTWTLGRAAPTLARRCCKASKFARHTRHKCSASGRTTRSRTLGTSSA